VTFAGNPHVTSENPDVLWEPTPETIARTQVGRYLDFLRTTRGVEFADYDALWKWSVEDLPGFWRSVYDYFDVAAEGDPSQVLVGNTMPDVQWFPEVRLNYAENMLRGVDGQVVVTALSQTRQKVELTRGELRDAVARAATGMRKLGVARGDRVVAYLPNIPEALVAMLATASIGAIWAVCAPELGTQSVLDRLTQLDPTLLITVDGYRYGDKDIDRSAEVATIRGRLPSLTATVHVPYRDARPTPPGAIEWGDLLAENAPPVYDRVPFGHPLWVLFSSGTTGLPKAIVHSHGGITLELQKTLALHSDLGSADRYFVFCTTTWVMWNIQVSALLLGSAIVLMDGNPAFPDHSRLWGIVEETAVTVFGCGATFLMACRKAGTRPCDEYDLSVLRGMFTTGSPLPPEGFRWVYEAVDRNIYFQSSSGGTDICSSFVGGTPLLPLRAGEITAPALGVLAQALDAEGNSVIDRPGELVISAPMPSMPVHFWNDPADLKYRGAYFADYPGKWRQGDWVVFNERGGCVITGRSDGTLNRGGVRLGTSEFYSALEGIDEVDDSLVVHLDDPLGGMGTLLLFVQLCAGASLDDDLRSQIVRVLRQRLSPRHVPDEIIAVPAVPYNLTGKKLEVPVKRLLQGVPRSGVVSDGSVRNPESLDAFTRVATQLRTSLPA
jgi:acetoacetyl-CoA synthetase